MKPTGTRLITLCVVLGILTACTTNSPALSTAASASPVVTQATSPMRASDRMFYWQEEARELHAMATRREREAELMLKKQPGPGTNEFVKQMRLLAHQLRQAGTYADAQAKEAEGEIFPDRIKQFHSALR